MKIAIIGGTGLVGKHCIQQLLLQPEVEVVYSLARQALDIQDPKLLEVIGPQLDFAKMCEGLEIDVGISCLGTTIKQAKTRAHFEAIDFGIPLAFAKELRARGVQHFHHVSSIGASMVSGNFYLRTKGRLEKALGDLGFASLHLYRPSLLLGLRTQRRLGESALAIALGSIGPLFPSWLLNYRPIEAKKLARFMVCQVLHEEEGGLQVWENSVFHRGYRLETQAKASVFY